MLPFSASTFDTPLRSRTLGEWELGLSEMPKRAEFEGRVPFFRDGPIVGERHCS